MLMIAFGVLQFFTNVILPHRNILMPLKLKYGECFTVLDILINKI